MTVLVEFLRPDLKEEVWEYCEEETRLMDKNKILLVVHWSKIVNLDTSKLFKSVLKSPVLLFSFLFFFPSFSIARFYESDQYNFIGPIPKKDLNESIFHSGRQYFISTISQKHVHSYINIELVHKKTLPYIFSENKLLPKNIRRPKIFDFREYQYRWYEKYRYIFLAQDLDPNELTIYPCY
jgi:hypothetical protein